MTDIHLVFDGPPGPVSGRFVETEDALGKSINAGTWMQRADGYWILRIKQPNATKTYHVHYVEVGYEKTPFDRLIEAKSASEAVSRLTPRQKMVRITVVE